MKGPGTRGQPCSASQCSPRSSCSISFSGRHPNQFEDNAMGLDIRVPIGLMFGVLGALLGGFGLISDKAIYDRSLGININIWWGLILLAFGLVMFILGQKGTSAARPADDTPEGRKMEERDAQFENKPRRGGH